MTDLVRFASAMSVLEHRAPSPTNPGGVGRTDLFATADGEPLYRDLGFRAAPSPALRRP